MKSTFRIKLGIVIGFVFLIFLLFIINFKENVLPKSEIGGGYYKNSSGIFIDNAWGRGFAWGTTKISSADVNTFNYIGGYYAKDKNNGYFLDYSFNADTPTLVSLSVNDNYAKDKNNVYYQGKIIKYANVNNFEFITNSWARTPYTKDLKNVYFGDKKLEDSDPKTFIVTYPGWDYARDRKQLYKEDKIIVDADIETFKPLSNEFAKDKNNIYFMGDKINYANADNFKILNAHYAKDDKNVYYIDWGIEYSLNIIKNADAKTFEVIDDFSAKDKNYIYSKDKKIEK